MESFHHKRLCPSLRRADSGGSAGSTAAGDENVDFIQQRNPCEVYLQHMTIGVRPDKRRCEAEIAGSYGAVGSTPQATLGLLLSGGHTGCQKADVAPHLNLAGHRA